MRKGNLQHIINQVSLQLEREFDKDFLRRMYNTPIEFYKNRLRAIGFEGLPCVLDAGCGFGQWALAISELNTVVHGVDISELWVRVAYDIFQRLNCKNVFVTQASIDCLPYSSEVFDGIFCFSSIYATDYPMTLKEFFRVLKPKGRLYVCTNGLGWYLYNLIENHNPSKDFNPRMYALDTIWNSTKYRLFGKCQIGKSLIMSPAKLESALKYIGFKVIQIAPEGHINLSNVEIIPIYAKRYLGFTNVFELVAHRE